MSAVAITIHGEEFIILPRQEFDRLRGIPDGSAEALPFVRNLIARDLRQARLAAGITQSELAKKLKRSQAFVSGAENGTSRVGERYVRAVLKACGLPEDWKAPE
jgi:ribosome-binding protein aMBF1 (putative translation factor)